jgi:hypothetical protein
MYRTETLKPQAGLFLLGFCLVNKIQLGKAIQRFCTLLGMPLPQAMNLNVVTFNF